MQQDIGRRIISIRMIEFEKKQGFTIFELYFHIDYHVIWILSQALDWHRLWIGCSESHLSYIEFFDKILLQIELYKSLWSWFLEHGRICVYLEILFSKTKMFCAELFWACAISNTVLLIPRRLSDMDRLSIMSHFLSLKCRMTQTWPLNGHERL